MIWELLSTHTVINNRFDTLHLGTSSLGFLNPGDDALAIRCTRIEPVGLGPCDAKSVQQFLWFNNKFSCSRVLSHM